jgi:hypothetical protein
MGALRGKRIVDFLHHGRRIRRHVEKAAPFFMPSINPPAPSATRSTSVGSGSEVKTTD